MPKRKAEGDAKGDQGLPWVKDTHDLSYPKLICKAGSGLSFLPPAPAHLPPWNCLLHATSPHTFALRPHPPRRVPQVTITSLTAGRLESGGGQIPRSTPAVGKGAKTRAPLPKARTLGAPESSARPGVWECGDERQVGRGPSHGAGAEVTESPPQASQLGGRFWFPSPPRFFRLGKDRPAPPAQVQEVGRVEGSGYLGARRRARRRRPRPGPPAAPLLCDALGQLRAGGRGVGREDSVAGASGVHGRRGSGAGARDTESRGRGERGQQQQLLGHRPARGAVTAGPARACTRSVSNRETPVRVGKALRNGAGWESSEVRTLAYPTPRTAAAERLLRPAPPPESQRQGHRPLRASEECRLERPQAAISDEGREPGDSLKACSADGACHRLG
nr:uncharacterized protein LOC112424505 [Macaca nemestrina]